MSRKRAALIDRQSGQTVDAVLDTDLPLLGLIDAEDLWSPFRLRTIRQFLSSGGPLPEHVHWNWAMKALQFDHSLHCFCGIEAMNQIQGLMWLWLRGRSAQLPPALGEALVYVDFIETAPWNAREYTANPRFKGVGTQLLQAAVLRSQEEGLDGRVGLHALPQSEAFYAGVCGMQNLGSDPAYQNLMYFEFSGAAAVSFLNR